MTDAGLAAYLTRSDDPDFERAPAGRPVLQVTPVRAGSQTMLALDGEIDLTTAGLVRDATARCLRDQPVCLMLDMGSVSFCDCAGVRALQWALRRATASRSGFRIISLQPPVRRTLTLLGARDLLGAVQDGQAATSYRARRTSRGRAPAPASRAGYSLPDQRAR